jgi:hypothetical protein
MSRKAFFPFTLLFSAILVAWSLVSVQAAQKPEGIRYQADLSPTAPAGCDILQSDPNEEIFFTSDDIQGWLHNTSTQEVIQIRGLTTVYNGGWHDEVTPEPVDNYLDIYRWNNVTIYNPDNVFLTPDGAVISHPVVFTIQPEEASYLVEDFTRSFTTYYILQDTHRSIWPGCRDRDAPRAYHRSLYARSPGCGS